MRGLVIAWTTVFGVYSIHVLRYQNSCMPQQKIEERRELVQVSAYSVQASHWCPRRRAGRHTKNLVTSSAKYFLLPRVVLQEI